MFNLLMRYTAWNDGRDSIAVERCFEYTRDDLEQRYKQGNTFLLDELIRFPCLFMEEGTGPEIARVGRIIEARVENREIHFEYMLEPGIPEILNSQIYANRRDFSMPQDFEFSRGHWAIKDVDLYRAVLRIGRPQRQRPRAFNLPEQENIAERQISVMMPFDGRFRAVYDSIETMARRNGLRCNRADNIWENDHVIQDVVNLIDRSRIVICDLSERNPNVFYEVGIAHTLGREVILITQNRNDVPFDLQGIRNVHYLNNDQGIEELVRQLETRIHDIYAA